MRKKTDPWDPQTRVSLPKSPDLVVATQDGSWPYAVATDSKGARACFVRDSNFQWHRVSQDDLNRIIEWAVFGEAKITPSFGKRRTLDVVYSADPEGDGFTVRVLPFEVAA